MAEPFTVFTSKVVPLPAENVDTDQIVPARYLKVTDKDGLAEALFRDWRFDEDGSLKEPPFVLDRPGMTGRRSSSPATTSGPGRHASTRRGRSPPGASGRSSPRPTPTSSGATASRTACCRSSSMRRRTRGCSTAGADEPDAEFTVDLAEQGVLLPDGDDHRLRHRPVRQADDPGRHRRARLPPVEGDRDRGLGGAPPASHRFARRSALTGRRAPRIVQPRRGDDQRMSMGLRAARRTHTGQPTNGVGR